MEAEFTLNKFLDILGNALCPSTYLFTRRSIFDIRIQFLTVC